VGKKCWKELFRDGKTGSLPIPEYMGIILAGILKIRSISLEFLKILAKTFARWLFAALDNINSQIRQRSYELFHSPQSRGLV
jgi:hypothetical protein